MNEERVPVRQWQALYRTGAFYTSEYSAMEKAGWYNWNCSSESLAERLKNLANVVMGVTHTPPSFILGQVERYRELYVFGAELSIPEKTPVRPKTVQRGGRER